MKRKDKMYGFKTSDVVDHLGEVIWPNGKPKARHERYLSKALSSVNIPKDTVFLLTKIKRHSYDMMEIAPGRELINGEEKDIFAVFVHEFSVAELEWIYRNISFFFPCFSSEDMDDFVVSFIRKVIWHELGHRKAWIEKGILDGAKDKLRDTEDEAEIYAMRKIEKEYGKRFVRKFRIYNFAVFCDMVRSEKN